MKYKSILFFVFNIFIFISFDYAQNCDGPPPINYRYRELSFIKNTSSQSNYQVRISALSPVWDQSGSTITEGCGCSVLGATTTITTTIVKKDGFDGLVLFCGSSNQLPPYFGLGLYKVSLLNNGLSFYVDIRDADYDGYHYLDNDIDFTYNSTLDQLTYLDANLNSVVINDGDVIAYWKANHKNINSNIANTSIFSNFWQNSLKGLRKNNNPLLIIGFHPNHDNGTKYQIYRKYQTPFFKKIATLTLENNNYFIDNAVDLNQNSAQYYVRAKFNSGSLSTSSNTVTVYKIAQKYSHTEPVTNISIFKLYNAYPNPFNPSTVIEYSIAKDSKVTLTVYNIEGKIISTLVDDYQSKGDYSVTFNGVHLPSGTYFYKLSTPEFTQMKKMVLIK